VEHIGEGVEHLLHELSVLSINGHEVPASGFVLTNYAFFLIIASVVTLTFFLLGARRVKFRPESRYGNLMEMGVEFVRDNLIADIMGSRGLKYLPFIGTVFFFVLFNNLIGLIPGSKPGTGTMGTTVTWAIVVFVTYHGIGIKNNGLVGYIKHFWPKGVWPPLAAFVALLEIISDFIRPLTLSVRLFANMYAGHIMLGIFSLFTVILFEATGAMKIAAVLPIALQVALYALELFVAVIQAYIFAVLTAVYINGALGSH